MDLLTDPRVVAAMIAGLFGLLFLAMNKKFKRIELSIAEANTLLNAQMNERTADLKEVELSNHSAHHAGQIMFQRFKALKHEISELKALLYLHFDEKGPFSMEMQTQVNQLTASISHWVSPRGDFNEEFVMQLGQIREFFEKGGDYWINRKHFIGAFDLNCWMLIDAEYDQVIETLMSGELVQRRELLPHKPEYVFP